MAFGDPSLQIDVADQVQPCVAYEKEIVWFQL